jgi:saccharopine dehydrogenase-like NADP-dependent oxidoreductase
MRNPQARTKDVVVIGAGKIGTTVAGLLAATYDYRVARVDHSSKPRVLSKQYAVGRMTPETPSRFEIANGD